jgi:hypothetical protein
VVSSNVSAPRHVSTPQVPPPTIFSSFLPLCLYS